MAAEPGLRRRLALMLVATAGAIALLLPFTFWLAGTQLEGVAREDLLAQQLLTLIRDDSPPFDVDTGRSQIRYFRPTLGIEQPLPPELRALQPGVYRGLAVEGHRSTVHVRDAAPQDRAYLVYDIEFVKDIELGLWLFVTALALLIGIAAWIFARGMVNRALAPFSELLAEVRALVPGRRGQRLELPHKDRELQVILDGFNSYLAEIDRLVERERTFAAAASHELRTPLTVIQGAARLIEESAQTPERLRQRLLRAVRDLASDLDALLALSQSHESPAFEALRLDEWLPQLTDSYIEATHATSFVKWIAPQPVHLAAPPGAVNVVFGNLLRNALRAARGGEVVVEVTPSWVAVTDSGPGIPPHELPRLFEPRFRGHDGGSGMGLYISRTLAARYGWRIQVTNRAEGGVRALWSFHQAGPVTTATNIRPEQSPSPSAARGG